MSLHDRYKTEKAKWDSIAQKKGKTLKPYGIHEDFHSFARNDSEFPGVSEFLGDLNGKRVLEIGCGSGKTAVLLSKSGANVTAFDLSPLSVNVTKQRAMINGVEMDLIVSAGEYLPFADDGFDIIFGKAILHHLVIEMGQPDLYRVLRKGGKAVFIEPMGMNPFLTFIRRHVPYAHKHLVGVDRPLTYKDMDTWTKDFEYRRFLEIQLFSMLERGFGWDREFPLLRKTDIYLLEKFPLLKRYCRYVVLFATK